MNKIILMYPYYTYPRKNPPLGLAYLASYIRERDFLAHIVDLNIRKYTDRDIENIIQREKPLAVGISFMTNQYEECRKLAILVKKISPATLVIGGGPHASALPKDVLNDIHELDIVVMGEGEETFLEILQHLQNSKRDMAEIKGVCFRSNGSIVKTASRPLIHDVDALPMPAWDLLAIDEYSVFSPRSGKTFALLSSRGCPNHCTFCDSHTVFGRKFRGRSAQNIFKEIMFLHDTCGMTQFDFVDDMITLERKRIFELCGLVQHSGISFTWMANARVNTLDEELMAVMKESGCMRIDVGVESGDPQVQKRMKKNITNDQVRKVHEIARKLGIQMGTFVMVGNLGETRESVRMTVNLLKDIADDVMVSIACPFPGTELYQEAQEKGYLRVFDWSRYVTSPTYKKDYEPVMVTDSMNQKEIMQAYYYLHSFFAKKKFQARYGKYFLVNPRFIKEWLLQSIRQGDVLKKAGMFVNMVKSRFVQ